jgi:hypothetical protein
MIRAWLATFLAISAWESGAHAQPPPASYRPFQDLSLTETITEMSPAASRRAIKADLIDLEDELRAISTPASRFCRGSVRFPRPVYRLEKSPIRTSFARLGAEFQLNAGERERYRDLLVRESSDRTEQLQIAIERQWFLMRVTDRLYQDEIDLHLDRFAERPWYSLGADRCDAYVTRIARDQELRSAMTQLLTWFDVYEQVNDAGLDLMDVLK